MAQNKNKFDLSRRIPIATKRKIRQDAGFGCVHCGNGIFTYEHIDPEFSKAKKHDPAKMTLLCHQCAGKHTRGQLSKETIWKAKRDPFSRRSGYSFESFDFGTDHPTIQIGRVSAIDCDSLIEIFGEPIVSISKASEKGKPYEVSAIFKGTTGEILLKIEKNEWIAPTNAWDIEFVGQRLSITSKEMDHKLVIVSIPPNTLIVEQAHMNWDGNIVRCAKGDLSIQMLDGQIVTLGVGRAGYCRAAISVDENGVTLGLAREVDESRKTGNYFIIG